MAAPCVSGHSAYIFDRGGSRRVGPISSITQLQWARQRDNTSEATVRLEGKGCTENLEIVGGSRTHRQELVIYRGQERVWEGPIHRITTGPGYAEVNAHDVSEYLFFQPLTQAWENSTLPDGTIRVDTVTGRIEKIIQYELAHGRDMFYPNTIPNAAAFAAAWQAAGGTLTATGDGTGWTVHIPAWEDSTVWPAVNVLPHLDVRHFTNEAQTAMDTAAYETTVGDHLQSLARQNGIDFTVLGRKILIWDVSRNLGVLQTMTDKDFANRVIVTEYGSDHNQAAYSVGADGVYGAALNLENLAFYGPWTTMYTIYNENGTATPTQGELDSQARRNTSGRSPSPIEVRIPDNSTIFLSPDVGINALVPGVQVPLRATLNARDLAQQQKIDSVTVTETADGENVQVTLTPATKPDSDTPAVAA